MNIENTFRYTYNAQGNQEVMSIRQKYLPREETRLEELRRLDRMVQTSGIIEALSIGVGGCLIFGLGMCLAMEVIGHAAWLGILMGLLGTAAMACAYPAYRKFFNKAKRQYTPRILQLSEMIINQH